MLRWFGDANFLGSRLKFDLLPHGGYREVNRWQGGM